MMHFAKHDRRPKQHQSTSIRPPAYAVPRLGDRTNEHRTGAPAHRFVPEALENLSSTDRLLFEQFGQGPVQSPPFDCIHWAIEAQAAERPGAIAVEHQGTSITYGELNWQADRLAALLTRHGVSTGDAVALYLKRSTPMVVGILAILKTGAAYVPQHVGVAPEGQLRHILDVTKAKVTLTISSLRDQVPVPDGHVCIEIDRFMEPANGAAGSLTLFQPAQAVTRDDRCFILFTSGTTGNPNGVQVTHGNVTNILLTQPGDLGIEPGMRVGQILSIAFDMAAWEILGALSHGATLVIRGKDIEETVSKVDVVIATPSVLGSCDAERCRNVKIVAVAGEPCPAPLADTWSRFARFHNSCGPTETTIVNTVQHYKANDHSLTIGKPTPNNTVYVLDELMQPCAIGDVGEMWAGGECVSAGYLANPELTAERYRPDPFLANGRLMFRTRDLGRWTENGELEHLGRTDDQVKVRGFRVELDSVSGAMESTPGCMKAVTLKLDNRNLVGFVTPATVHVEAAKQAVADALPYYCVPATIFAMDDLPVTPRGKVDKRSLLAMATEHEAMAEHELSQPVEAEGNRSVQSAAPKSIAFKFPATKLPITKFPKPKITMADFMAAERQS